METKRPSQELQQAIAQKLQLDPNTVANFFMNARRFCLSKFVAGKYFNGCINQFLRFRRGRGICEEAFASEHG